MIRVSDLCLVPCRPTPADLRSVSPTLAAIHRLEKDFAFVLNQTPPKGFRVRDTSEGLKVLGMLADVAVVSRTDHQDAIGAGQGVTEFIRRRRGRRDPPAVGLDRQPHQGAAACPSRIKPTSWR